MIFFYESCTLINLKVLTCIINAHNILYVFTLKTKNMLMLIIVLCKQNMLIN